MVVSLAACGGGGSNSSSGKTTIMWWIADWEEDEAKQVIADYTKDHPDVEIKYQTFAYENMDQQELMGLQSSDPPDLLQVMVAWTPSFASKDVLEPIDSYVEESEMDTSDFFSATLEASKYEDQMYGIPYRGEAMGLYWNKAMFRDAGLDPEQPPTTLAELRDFAIKLTKDIDGDGATDQYGYGMVAGQKGDAMYRWLPIIKSFGGDLLNAENNESAFGTPESREGIQWQADLFLKDHVVPEGAVTVDSTGIRDLFMSGTTAMYIAGQWDTETIQAERPDIEFGTALIPGVNEGEPSPSILGGWMTSMSKGCDNKEAAWDFLNYCTSTEVQEYFTMTFPARRSSMEAERYQNPMLAPFAEALDIACVPSPPIEQYPEVEGVCLNMFQAILSQQKDVDTAIDDCVKEVNELFE
jgi:multiple sugar transport system substrate-binding protein